MFISKNAAELVSKTLLGGAAGKIETSDTDKVFDESSNIEETDKSGEVGTDFEKFDLNEDGAISQEEFEAYQEHEEFMKRDVNEDGVVSHRESVDFWKDKIEVQSSGPFGTTKTAVRPDTPEIAAHDKYMLEVMAEWDANHPEEKPVDGSFVLATLKASKGIGMINALQGKSPREEYAEAQELIYRENNPEYNAQQTAYEEKSRELGSLATFLTIATIKPPILDD